MWWYLICFLNFAFTQEPPSGFTDDGFLYTCPSKVFDLLISNEATHSMQIFHVVDETKRIQYNISNAADLVTKKSFDKNKKTVIFTHNYLENPKLGGAAIGQFIRQYTSTNDTNLVLLDSSPLIGTNLYFMAARVVRYVGNRFGMVLAQLTKTGIDPEKLQLIGHGLGGHILGYAGKTFYRLTGKRVPRIVALDPTGPCFRTSPPSERLDRNDAQLVQVIHTNGAALGLKKAVGHVDFYINGGLNQPASPGSVCIMMCSHYRAVDLWISALRNPQAFKGLLCKDEYAAEHGECKEYLDKSRRSVTMGPELSPQAKGIFYIRTTNVPPFFKEE